MRRKPHPRPRDERSPLPRGREGGVLLLRPPTATRVSSPTRSASTSARHRGPARRFRRPGPHCCLGAHLARREITVMFRELFRRRPGIRSVGSPNGCDPVSSTGSSGWTAASEAWTPSGRWWRAARPPARTTPPGGVSAATRSLSRHADRLEDGVDVGEQLLLAVRHRHVDDRRQVGAGATAATTMVVFAPPEVISYAASWPGRPFTDRVCWAVLRAVLSSGKNLLRPMEATALITGARFSGEVYLLFRRGRERTRHQLCELLPPFSSMAAGGVLAGREAVGGGHAGTLVLPPRGTELGQGDPRRLVGERTGHR